MALTLWGFPAAFKTQKTLIAAKYVGVEIKTPSFEFGVFNKTPEFLAKNPNGKVPVLDTENGSIYESNAIARYVARLRPDAGLLGASFYENALVDQWIDFSTNELEPARGVWAYTIMGALPSQNPKPLQEAKKDVEKALSILDAHFLHNTFLVGNQVTLADIAVFCALMEGYTKLFSPALQKKFANVLRWFNTVANQPNVAAVVGKITFATAEAQAAKPAAAPKKEAAPKEEKPKAAAAPKPADDDDDEKPAASKKANPLDELPPSSMVLDSVKKLAFSQRPILPDFFEQLWPQYDNAGYTWFIFNYKYNEDNTVYFKTGNLIGGFVQRSDAARKHSMGVINVRGNEDEETGPFKVSGAWLFRGPGISAEMIEENPDSEYYDWVKVDVTTPEGKQQIKDQFLAERLEGEKVLDRRYFK